VWRPGIYDLPEIDRSRIYVPQRAAISRITGQDARGTSATSSVTATYPVATTSGNLLIASLWANVGLGLETMTGWTIVDTCSINTTSSAGLWYRLSDGTETTVTGGATGAGSMRLHVYEYTGNANPVVVDQHANVDNGSGTVTSLASSTINTANANDLLFAVFGLSSSVTGITFSNSFNARQTDATVRMCDADQIVAATGAYTTTMSWTTAVRAGAVIAGFQAVAAASGFTPRRALMGVGL
jgi:hypothetical protein